MPAAVSPGFHPGVVVVGMCPARGIDLSCRNADRTQGCNRKRGFLTTATDGSVHTCQRGQGAGITRLVGHMFVAPVIHLQYGFFHAQSLHPVLQFLIEHRTRHIQCLVIDAQGKHEVIEQQFRHFLAPGHLLSSLEGGAHVIQVELQRVIGHIGQRHISIQEL